MEKATYEYILHVYRKQPESIHNLPQNRWRAHVTHAPQVPRIGELIESSNGWDTRIYRVFDIVHSCGSGLSELVLNGMKDIKESQVPIGEKGLIHVHAYSE